ncbi:MAG: 7-cyano-7-deazaguanine synthase QueC [Thermoplasmataceae archaeon]
MHEKAVCLLSGGLDSSTTLAIAISRGYKCHAISFRYGQVHNRELVSAARIADHFGVPHTVVDIDLKNIAISALTGYGDIPRRNLNEIGQDDIPASYVPSRNIIFLSIAAAMAEGLGTGYVFIGANALDYSGYPDCRPEFFREFENALNAGTKIGLERGFRIQVPLQYLKKSEIIKLGTKLGVPYEMTTSCYRGGEIACGQCDSCLLRLRGFMEAGIRDPLPYATYPDFYQEFLKKNF